MSREMRLVIRWIVIGTVTLTVLGFVALIVGVGLSLGYPLVSVG